MQEGWTLWVVCVVDSANEASSRFPLLLCWVLPIRQLRWDGPHPRRAHLYGAQGLEGASQGPAPAGG